MQLFIVFFTLFICLVYIARRIYFTIKTKAGNPCHGCQLKQTCSKHTMKVNGAQAPRQNKLHHDLSDSPYNGCAPSDSNALAPLWLSLRDHHNGMLQYR